MKKKVISSEEELSGFEFDGGKTASFFELSEPALSVNEELKSSLFTVKIDVLTEVVQISRQVYNVLDLLGDIGGLKDSLILIGSLLMQVFSIAVGNPLNNYLLGAIFKV